MSSFLFALLVGFSVSIAVFGTILLFIFYEWMMNMIKKMKNN